jgi:hypothetical protein
MLDFSEQEIEAYREFAETCKHSINLAVSGHTMKKANQHIIEALLRMRLFCNVGHVAFSKKWHKTGLPSDPEEALSFLQANGKATCVQCDCDISSMYQEDDRSSGSLTLCHHLICGECLPVYNEDLKSNLQNGRAQCSLCDQKGDLETFMIQPSAAALPPNPANVDLQSTKLKALVANIQDQGADDKRYRSSTQLYYVLLLIRVLALSSRSGRRLLMLLQLFLRTITSRFIVFMVVFRHQNVAKFCPSL